MKAELGTAGPLLVKLGVLVGFTFLGDLLCSGRSGVQLEAVPPFCRAVVSVLLCRGNVCARGVLLRWPLRPSARAIGVRYAITGFCIYETL